MKYLGIDYGQKKVGIAVGDSNSRLAMPLKVVRADSVSRLLEKVREVIFLEKTEKVIIGISEGKTAIETKAFGQNLSTKTNLEIDYVDETLTSKEAQNLSQIAGINRKKRKEMEDAYAAALILQSYFDNHEFE